MVCKYCGKEFSNNKRGRKKEYCDNPECIRRAKNEAQRKWYASKTKCLEGTKYRVVEQKEEKKVIYSSANREETRMSMQDIGDILEVARNLGTIRFQLVEMITKNSEQISKFDKEDQTFLHKLEFLEELTDEEAKEMIIAEKKSRELRRNVKNRRCLIETLLTSILLKNPNAFVVKSIQYEDDKDIYRRVAKLKKDDNLYLRMKPVGGNQ